MSDHLPTLLPFASYRTESAYEAISAVELPGIKLPAIQRPVSVEAFTLNNILPVLASHSAEP